MTRLTEEDLHNVWSFATETPGGDVDPKWLISMVEEIRVLRTTIHAEDEVLMVRYNGLKDSHNKLLQKYEARSETIDQLICSMDEINTVNLKLRIALKQIVAFSHTWNCPTVDGSKLICKCTVKIAQNALDNMGD